MVGARPNFVKMAPVVDAMRRRGHTRQLVVHTGQHYDRRLSGDILDDLGFPDPDVCLEVGSGTHGDQTGKVLVGFEQVLMERRPDLVVVAGDVNSTLACALAAAKLGVPVAHLEAGLRSEDWTMPEEINRVLTDRMSDVLLTHSPEAEPNLLREGIDPARIHYVGNTMIDSLRRLEGRARRRAAWRELGAERPRVRARHAPPAVERGRPGAPERDRGGAHRARRAGRPWSSRSTRARARGCAEAHGPAPPGARRTCAASRPAGYLDFLSLQGAAGAIVTDSGGVQEEASALGVPCYTFRANTERPVTLTHGTNVLLGDDPALIADVGPRRCRRRPRRSRSGTATPPSAPPTCSRPRWPPGRAAKHAWRSPSRAP